MIGRRAVFNRMLGREPKARLYKRLLRLWIVAGLCAVIILAVVGAILYSFFNEDVVEASEGFLAYLTVFALVFCDAIVPIFPGETTLSTASVLASQGTLELELIIVAGVYLIDRRRTGRTEPPPTRDAAAAEPAESGRER